MTERSASPTIRPARTSDAETLGRLGALLVEEHHAFDPARFIAPGPDTPRGYGRYLASRVGKKDAVLLVAEAEGAVVGYAYAGLEGPDWMALRGPAGVLYDILIDPAQRRKGVGRALLTAILEALDQRGAPQVVLFSATQNETAQRLFAAVGFRRTMVEMTRDR
ncbi:MAG TPA: GNAT family N-acetyltransferase [Caulobacteraceae bacterium]|nr:GNAT family N-acetyltransferase [Caulobacteraceae bacterium]